MSTRTNHRRGSSFDHLEQSTLRWKRRALGGFGLVLGLWAVMSPPGAAFAQPGPCFADSTNCSAGDADAPTLSVTSVVDGCNYPGDTATVVVRAGLRANTKRYDVGFNIAMDGGNAASGQCLHTFLQPEKTSCHTGLTSAERASGHGPYLDDDCQVGDTCSDLEGSLMTYYDFQVTVLCRDANGDGKVDAATMWSWDQNGDPTCNSTHPPVPGTRSKCKYVSLTAITNLPVPKRTIEVRKSVLAVTPDSGRFDLFIDNSPASPPTINTTANQGDGGTTGSVVVPTGTYVVGEFAASNTDPSIYGESISCVDTVGRCSNGDRCVSDAQCCTGTCNLTPVVVAQCTNCTVSPPFTLTNVEARIQCTITNTRRSIELAKVLVPETDAGLFDLRLDGVVEAEDQPSELLNTVVGVAPGMHHVSESAATGGTALSDYVASIECIDYIGRCSGGTNAGASCANDAQCTGGGSCDQAPHDGSSLRACPGDPVHRVRDPGLHRLERAGRDHLHVHECAPPVP